jgi:hypothetical protein
MSENSQQPEPATSAALKPFAVTIPVAQQLLGNKARSEVYREIASGRLTAVKDNGKTLITVESIERRQQSLPIAKMVPRGRHARRG